VTGSLAIASASADYDSSVPRSWIIAMAILIVCLIASIVIGAANLL
jgi:hypothetical protein